MTPTLGQDLFPQLAHVSELLTIEDLSALFKIPKATLYDWTHLGFIPHYKIGRHVRFDPQEVRDWLKARKVSGRRTRIPRLENPLDRD